MWNWVKRVSCVALLGIVSGCDVRPPEVRPVATPAGVAPIGMDPTDGGRAAPAQPAPGQPVAGQPAPAQPVPGQPVAGNPPPAENPPANDGKGIIGKMTAKVVDVKEAMAQNPNLKVVENKTGGDDPLTFAASAYVSARSQASLFGFQAWLKQFKIVEERNPSYAEFMQAMKENRVEFTALYQWQMYGYDSQAGTIVILEDGQMKAERYKAAGITE